MFTEKWRLVPYYFLKRLYTTFQCFSLIENEFISCDHMGKQHYYCAASVPLRHGLSVIRSTFLWGLLSMACQLTQFRFASYWVLAFSLETTGCFKPLPIYFQKVNFVFTGLSKHSGFYGWQTMYENSKVFWFI